MLSLALQTSHLVCDRHSLVVKQTDTAKGYASRDFLEATVRWLNGDELGDALLGPQRPSLYHKSLVAGQCLFFMVICYTYREIPVLDRRKIAVLIYSVLSTTVADSYIRLCAAFSGL